MSDVYQDRRRSDSDTGQLTELITGLSCKVEKAQLSTDKKLNQAQSDMHKHWSHQLVITEKIENAISMLVEQKGGIKQMEHVQQIGCIPLKAFKENRDVHLTGINKRLGKLEVVNEKRDDREANVWKFLIGKAVVLIGILAMMVYNAVGVG